MAEDTSIEEKENLDENTTDLDKEEQVESLEEDIEQKKDKKSILSKVLIGISALLLLIIIIGIILYFVGFFDPKPVKKLEKKNPLNEKVIKEKKYEFDLSSINSKKLNQQLSYLTNKNINQEKIEENEKIENEKKLLEEEKRKQQEKIDNEKNKLLKEKEELEAKKNELENQKNELEKLKQAAINLKEEMINTKEKLEKSQIEVIPIPIKEKNIEENKKTKFLKMLNVAKIKGELYKDYLDSIISIDSNVKLCRDDKNRIEIYYGPFKEEDKRERLLNELIKNGFEQSYSLELTQEEFDRRCNY